jgi:hypothetical protein
MHTQGLYTDLLHAWYALETQNAQDKQHNRLRKEKHAVKLTKEMTIEQAASNPQRLQNFDFPVMLHSAAQRAAQRTA